MTTDTDDSDVTLGMERAIERRDFIGGVAASAMLGAIAPALTVAEGTRQAARVPIVPAGDYPPAATGLRGQYVGSFEMAHAARDGNFGGDVRADETGESGVRAWDTSKLMSRCRAYLCFP